MQATTNATEPLGLATLGDGGSAPRERIVDADRCRALVERLVQNDQKRNAFDTRVKGMRDGNRPYKDSVLRKHAQSWRTNINWMEGKAMVSGAMVPYYDLLSGSPHYCGITLRGPDQFLAAQHSKTVTELFDEMLKGEPCFEHELMLAMHDRLTYGRGCVLWEDDFSPFFKWVNRFCVHVPDRTRSLVADLKVLVVEQDIEIDELYEKYTDAGAADRGWDKKACEEAIRRAESPSAQHSENRIDLEQRRAADKDILDGIAHNAVRAGHVYVKEFSGKISHYIVERDFTTKDATSTDPAKRPHGYLFKKVERWDSWSQAIWASFHEITDGSWNGASGMGKDILPQIEIKNRVKCSGVDLGFLRSAVNLSATTDSAYGKVGIIQHGPVNVYPPGYVPIPVATYVGDLDAMMALDMNIEQTIGRNTGIYRQLPEKANGNPLSATGEVLRNQQSATLTNSAVTRFYSDLDDLLSEMYRRAVDGPDTAHDEKVKAFRKACDDAGIPIDVLRKYKRVRAYRTAGNGSVVNRQQSSLQIAAIADRLPQKGQQEWIRDTISGLFNVETADRYFPVNPGDELTLDHSISMLENDSLAHGAPVLFDPNQNHVIHAQMHLQTAAQALQSVD